MTETSIATPSDHRLARFRARRRCSARWATARISAPWARWRTSSPWATGTACACGCWRSPWRSSAARRCSTAGSIDLTKSIYTAPRLQWLSSIVGGLAFGVGMALASGCGSKTLIRIGGGNLKSLVVFAFMAISAYMTLRGLFAVWRVGLLDPASDRAADQSGSAFAADHHRRRVSTAGDPGRCAGCRRHTGRLCARTAGFPALRQSARRQSSSGSSSAAAGT